MNAYRRFRFDIPLFLGTLLLVVIGVIMVFSSSGLLAGDLYGQPFYFMIQQIVGAAAGFAVVGVLLSVKKPFILHPVFVYGLLAVTGFLLTVCLAMPSIAHTHRWIVFMGFRFQPSELAKISLVLFFAYICETRKDSLNRWKTLTFPLGVLAGFVLLVLLEPDFGTALMLTGLACLVLFVGGVKIRRFLVVGAVGLVLFTIFLFSASYRLSRVQGFLASGGDPQGKGYQVRQSKVAVGSGGLIGVSLGQSTQKLYYLPSAHTDFIFAILGEEAGLVGTVVTVFLFGLLLWRGLKISIEAPDPGLKMAAAGLTFVLVVQALLNISVVLGLGPTKGTPLPFLSYGRSSLLCSLASVGLLLHISQLRNGLKRTAGT